MKSAAGAWILAALYVALCAASFANDRFLHDEGLLTHLFSELLARDFLPAFFLQKVRPPLALLYAVPASIGVGAFLWAHVLACALAIPVLAATARTLGHRQPNVAAAVLALSPMFVAGGAAGLSNADAVLGLCVVSLLWARERELWAGIVLGVLVWVRAELMVFVTLMLVWAAVRRRPRAVIGLLCWPLLYGLAGALYHAYLPWMLHFPPALSEPMPGNPFWQPHHQAASLPDLAGTAMALSPALVALALARAGRWRDLERWWGIAALAFVGALVLLPRWQVFNFDQSPRYLLPALPFVALAAGRAVERWGTASRVDALALIGVAALGIIGHRAGASLALCWAVLAVGIAVALAGGGRPRVAVLAFMGLLIAGPRHFAGGAKIERATQAAHVDEMVARIDEHAVATRRPIVTNEPILAAHLQRSAALPDLEVHYVVQSDQIYELSELSNRANGQRERIFAALSEGMYGRPIFPEALSPQALPDRALLVLTRDPRLSLVMPEAVWSAALDIVSPSARVTVAELKDDPRR